jgi:hypothetical protein
MDGPATPEAIEAMMLIGKWGYLEAKTAFIQFYLAHPNRSPDDYTPLTHDAAQAQALKNVVMSTAYADAQATLGAPNAAGLVLGSATTNGVSEQLTAHTTAGLLMMAGGIMGTFATGRGSHTAPVTVWRENEVVYQETLVSGNMTAEEAALGFPKSSLATHTEYRTVKQVPVVPGDVMTIAGQYPPCPSCKGAMNVAAQTKAVTIIYRWLGGEWSTER